MSNNVKEALELLCRYIRSLINVRLDPKDFTSAENDSKDPQVKLRLRETLSILSDYAVRLKVCSGNATSCLSRVDSDSYPEKLKFATLQYPPLEFYAPLTEGGSRILLITLAWLLATEDVLAFARQMKLAKGTPTDGLSRVLQQTRRYSSLPISSELDKILHLNGVVNANLKEISELKQWWCRLASKIGKASAEYRKCQPAACQNLPDLKAHEIALARRIVLLDGKGSAEDREKLREFNGTQELLEVHVKWLEVRHVFFDWMVTVMKRHTKRRNADNSMEDGLRLFISHLRHLIAGRCRDLQELDEMSMVESQKSTLNPPSRLQNIQCHSEASKWLDEMSEDLQNREKKLQEYKKSLIDASDEMITEN